MVLPTFFCLFCFQEPLWSYPRSLHCGRACIDGRITRNSSSDHPCHCNHSTEPACWSQCACTGAAKACVMSSLPSQSSLPGVHQNSRTPLLQTRCGRCGRRVRCVGLTHHFQHSKSCSESDISLWRTHARGFADEQLFFVMKPLTHSAIRCWACEAVHTCGTPAARQLSVAKSLFLMSHAHRCTLPVLQQGTGMTARSLSLQGAGRASEARPHPAVRSHGRTEADPRAVARAAAAAAAAYPPPAQDTAAEAAATCEWRPSCG